MPRSWGRDELLFWVVKGSEGNRTEVGRASWARSPGLGGHGTIFRIFSLK